MIPVAEPERLSDRFYSIVLVLQYGTGKAISAVILLIVFICFNVAVKVYIFEVMRLKGQPALK